MSTAQRLQQILDLRTRSEERKGPPVNMLIHEGSPSLAGKASEGEHASGRSEDVKSKSLRLTLVGRGGVGISVGVGEGVDVGVTVGCEVGVGVDVGMGVGADVGVDVRVGVGSGIRVGVGVSVVSLAQAARIRVTASVVTRERAGFIDAPYTSWSMRSRAMRA
jgi:hypothetical protein